MLSLTVFLPLATGFVILAWPKARPALVRRLALGGSIATLSASLLLCAFYDASRGGLQWQTRAPWIPGIGAEYYLAVDGLALPLMVLGGALLTASMLYVLPKGGESQGHAFLFLLMMTGVLGVFAAQDLLLFYVFFEVALVPLYFIVGIFGHERRRYAAVKFILYTRAGSLAMLLSFLALYLADGARTFSIPALVASRPLAAGSTAAGLVFFGMLIGFGVKLPVLPLHNWLPDAHVEAPTEGSVMLAGVLLKLGGFGVFRVLLPALPDTAREFGWLLIALGLVSIVYGALAALSQRDLKRMIAYTSIGPMGFVMLAAGAWALSPDPEVRTLAFTGAVYQMVSHGLLTGGMFFMVGMLQDQSQTRDIERFGGLMARMPVYSSVLGVLAFGSLGLPGLSGFVAEFQVVAASLSAGLWVAIIAVLGLLVTTGIYLRLVTQLLTGAAPDDMPALRDPERRELVIVGGLAAASLVLGIVPNILIPLIRGGL